jgi:hypothetical protein
LLNKDFFEYIREEIRKKGVDDIINHYGP